MTQLGKQTKMNERKKKITCTCYSLATVFNICIVFTIIYILIILSIISNLEIKGGASGKELVCQFFMQETSVTQVGSLG